jgi:hypothetical protein
MSKRNFNRHIQKQIQVASSLTTKYHISPANSIERSSCVDTLLVVSKQSNHVADIPLIYEIPNTNFTKIHFSNSNNDDNYKKPELVDRLKKNNFQVSCIPQFCKRVIIYFKTRRIGSPKRRKSSFKYPKTSNYHTCESGIIYSLRN